MIREVVEYRPPETTVLLDREGAVMATLATERRTVIGLRELPSYLPEAFIAIEDTNFAYHIGVDPRGIVRAAVINAVEGRAAQGASTITQQLPRNLLEWVGREKTIRRKALEALVALRMERLYAKDQILEVYLNQIYLGSGNYGVEAAAQAYFGKSAAEVSLAEAALLGGLPQLPEVYSPLNNPDRARERRDVVLARMEELGWITAKEYGEAVAAPVVPEEGLERPQRQADGGFFLDGVRQQLRADARVPAGALRAAGWRVETTMDPAAQSLAEGILAEGLEEEEGHWLDERPERWRRAQAEGEQPRPEKGVVVMAEVLRVYDDSGGGRSFAVELATGQRATLSVPAATAGYFEAVEPGDGVDVEVTAAPEAGSRLFQGRLLPVHRLQGALVAMDAASGEVLALAGGRRWGDRANGGYFNRATRAKRQVGSTIKPLVFAAAMEAGYTPANVIDDAPLRFADGYEPLNFERRFFGPTTLQEALEQSRNVVTVKLAREVGLESIVRGVEAFDTSAALGNAAWDLPRYYPVVLGSENATPLEMAAAYAPLANGGMRVEPSLWRRVRIDTGQVIEAEGAAPRRLLSARAAAHMVQMMAGVMSHGSGRMARGYLPPELRNACGGKSGTTNDTKDSWFVGFAPGRDGPITVAVWIGFDHPLPLGPHRTGGRSAGPIWGQFVAAYWRAVAPIATREPRLPLPAGWEAVPIDEDTGYRAEVAGAGDSVKWHVYPAGTAPGLAPPPAPEPLPVYGPGGLEGLIVDGVVVPAEALTTETLRAFAPAGDGVTTGGLVVPRGDG